MQRACGVLLLALLGCDPTAGLADSADAALPDVKRYFEGPGTQVTAGPWNRVVLDVDPDTLYHVGARRLDDAKPTFHLFGEDAREGCAVSPNAGTWLMGKPESAPFRVVPFLEAMDERGRGTLRFTTLDCDVQDLAIEDAGRPYSRIFENGYLVPTRQGYTLADPWQGKTREIAGNLQRVLLWGDAVLLWADDALKSFSEQLDPGSSWGNQVVSVVPLPVSATGNDYLVEDRDGLHHVRFDATTVDISAEDVLPGACHLQRAGTASVADRGAWIVVSTPCDNPNPTAILLDMDSLEVRDSLELPFPADARDARALLDWPLGDGTKPRPAITYLSVRDDAGFGELWAWKEGRESPLDLGQGADLDSAVLWPAASGWDGIVNVNHRQIADYWAYDAINFRWDGTINDYARSVVTDADGERLVNFDGAAGDLVASFFGDDFRIQLERVPVSYGSVTSYLGERRRARVDHFDGTSGRLLLGKEADDPSTWSSVGEKVAPDTPRFAWFMPALLFIENWDADTSSGSLVAYNYELDAKATIADGVSSFDLTTYPWNSVVYTVPRGKKRGIWVAKAK